MRACATPGGGVMFIPDELERKQAKDEKISFAEIAPEKPQKKSFRLFGRRSKEEKLLQAAA